MIAGSVVWLVRESRHAVWRDRICHVSYDFSNATVYTSRATSRGVTQLLVAPRSLARPKGLVLANIVWGELFIKFYFKKG
jgi:hypothetical protein